MFNVILRTLLIAIGILLISACSRLDVAYRSLDWLIPWRLDQYLDLTPEQKKRLDAHLQSLLSWHCQTQLPLYADLLDNGIALAQQTQARPEQISELFDHGEQSLQAIAVQVTPASIELLSSLDDKQIEKLRGKLEGERQKLRHELLDIPLDEQNELRAERMEERVAPWIGKLNALQKASIEAWADELSGQNEIWLQNRTHWQNMLLTELETRREADFPARITRFLQERHSSWLPEYREIHKQGKTRLVQLFVDLHRQSTPEQRQRMQERLGKLRSDMRELQCRAPTAAASASR
jgi:hypothetical protein